MGFGDVARERGSRNEDGAFAGAHGKNAGLDARARRVEHISAIAAQKRLSHLAARGIAGTQKENLGFHVGLSPYGGRWRTPC